MNLHESSAAGRPSRWPDRSIAPLASITVLMLGQSRGQGVLYRQGVFELKGQGVLLLERSL